MTHEEKIAEAARLMREVSDAIGLEVRIHIWRDYLLGQVCVGVQRETTGPAYAAHGPNVVEAFREALEKLDNAETEAMNSETEKREFAAWKASRERVAA